MPASKFEFGWDNNREQQRIAINVQEWQYKVFVETLKNHETSFGFEGVTEHGLEFSSGPAGLLVLGHIEVPWQVLYPSEDEPQPDDVGEFILTDAKDRVSITLRVGPDTSAELFRTFSATFGNNGGISLVLSLRHPKGAEPGYSIGIPKLLALSRM